MLEDEGDELLLVEEVELDDLLEEEEPNRLLNKLPELLDPLELDLLELPELLELLELIIPPKLINEEKSITIKHT